MKKLHNLFITGIEVGLKFREKCGFGFHAEAKMRRW